MCPYHIAYYDDGLTAGGRLYVHHVKANLLTLLFFIGIIDDH